VQGKTRERYQSLPFGNRKNQSILCLGLGESMKDLSAIVGGLGISNEIKQNLEAASGFEPLHRGFADLSLNHLGTPP
jgi:hypothetical protein